MEAGSDSVFSIILRLFPVEKETPVSIKRDPADTKDTIKTKSARIMNVFFIFTPFLILVVL